MAVVGLGLVGGSIARALTGAGHPVVGVDRRRVANAALRCGAVAALAPDVATAAIRADVVVLAAPPDTNVLLLDDLAGSDVAITDVTSVKQPIVARAVELRLTAFVGGHPVAGREKGGFGSSDAALFVGRPWILTPVRSTRRDAVRRVSRLVRSCGARPTSLTPAVHDRTFAYLSHLPQVVSWALLSAAQGDRVAGLRLPLAGGGFRDATRLAASPPELWRQILGQNRAEAGRALRAFERALARTRREMGL